MNQVNLAGYLAVDPQIKDQAKGKFAVLTVVTNDDGKRDETTGEAKQYSEFHRVVCWDGRTAENLGRFARDQGTALIGHSALARLVPPERRIGLAVNELSCAGPALPGMLRRIASEVARLRARAAGAG